MMNLGSLIFEVALKDNTFIQGLAGADKQMESFSKRASKVGGDLTKNLTVPIIGLGTVALKLASDFEVSSRKFTKAFDGAGTQASASLEKLNKEYGISISQGTQLLGFTGDLLKGFGASSEKALELSESTQILSASLAAYNGVPVKQASEAVTAALLGERDSLKQLGVVISEAAVQRQLLKDGTADLQGQELLLAKGQATLTLAYEQSSDAVESFTENTDTAAYQTQALLGQMQDLAVELGTILLPIFKDVVSGLREGVVAFSDLDDQTKENILKIAGLVAVIGPAAVAVGKLTTAIRILSTANVAVLAVTAALATVGAGIAIINRELKESGKIADINKRLANGTASFADKLSVVNTELEKENKLFLKQREAYNTNVGKAKENARATLLATSVRIDGINEIITNIKAEQAAEEQKIRDASDAEQALAAEKAKIAAEEQANEQKKKEAADALIQKYIDQNKAVQAILASGKTETQLIDEQIAAITELKLADSSYRTDQEAAVAMLQAKKQAIIDAEVAAEQKKLDDIAAAKLAADEAEEALEVAKAKQDALDREKEIADAEALYTQLSGFASSFASQIANIYSDITRAKIAANDAQLTDAINALDEEALGEEAYEARVTALKKEAAEEEYNIKLASWKTQKALDTTAAIIAGAVAAVNAFKSLASIPIAGPVLGAAAAAGAVAMTVAQVAVINSQPAPAKPRLQYGGIVNPSVTGTDVTIGEAGSPEAVIPLNDEFFGKLASAANGSTLGSTGDSVTSNSGSTIIVNLDGKTIAKNTIDLVNNKVYTINAASIR